MASSNVAHKINSKKRTTDVLMSENVDFSGLLLSESVQKGLLTSGFEKPSPIQLKAIPLGRCGLDLIVQAKSGTGKTCVFSVIALENLQISSSALQVLVLAPTREIAVQIQDVIKNIGSCMSRLSCHAFIGGLPVKDDIQKLKRCHIAIGSPGRVKQLIESGIMSTDSIRLFVLDEADKLLEDSFQEQVNWIYSSLPENKQILALSATYPEYLAQHLTAYMRNPTFIRLNISDPALLGIKQYKTSVPYHPLPNKQLEIKTETVISILSNITFKQCLIFSNYQTRAQNLCSDLQSKGWPTTCIAGSLDQKERLEAMDQLKTYKCRVLISTDLTSRGIDAEKVDLVINLDVPYDHETYLHRIGRAGRYGSFGAAISIVSEGKEETGLRAVERKCNTTISPLPDPIPNDLVKIEIKLDLEKIISTEQLITRVDGSTNISSVKSEATNIHQNDNSNTEMDSQKSENMCQAAEEIVRDNYSSRKVETNGHTVNGNNSANSVLNADTDETTDDVEFVYPSKQKFVFNDEPDLLNNKNESCSSKTFPIERTDSLESPAVDVQDFSSTCVSFQKIKTPKKPSIESTGWTKQRLEFSNVTWKCNSDDKISSENDNETPNKPSIDGTDAERTQPSIDGTDAERTQPSIDGTDAERAQPGACSIDSRQKSEIRKQNTNENISSKIDNKKSNKPSTDSMKRIRLGACSIDSGHRSISDVTGKNTSDEMILSEIDNKACNKPSSDSTDTCKDDTDANITTSKVDSFKNVYMMETAESQASAKSKILGSCENVVRSLQNLNLDIEKACNRETDSVATDTSVDSVEVNSVSNISGNTLTTENLNLNSVSLTDINSAKKGFTDSKVVSETVKHHENVSESNSKLHETENCATGQPNVQSEAMIESYDQDVSTKHLQLNLENDAACPSHSPRQERPKKGRTYQQIIESHKNFQSSTDCQVSDYVSKLKAKIQTSSETFGVHEKSDLLEQIESIYTKVLHRRHVQMVSTSQQTDDWQEIRQINPKKDSQSEVTTERPAYIPAENAENKDVSPTLNLGISGGLSQYLIKEKNKRKEKILTANHSSTKLYDLQTMENDIKSGALKFGLSSDHQSPKGMVANLADDSGAVMKSEKVSAQTQKSVSCKTQSRVQKTPAVSQKSVKSKVLIANQNGVASLSDVEKFSPLSSSDQDSILSESDSETSSLSSSSDSDAIDGTSAQSFQRDKKQYRTDYLQNGHQNQNKAYIKLSRQQAASPTKKSTEKRKTGKTRDKNHYFFPDTQNFGFNIHEQRLSQPSRHSKNAVLKEKQGKSKKSIDSQQGLEDHLKQKNLNPKATFPPEYMNPYSHLQDYYYPNVSESGNSDFEETNPEYEEQYYPGPYGPNDYYNRPHPYSRWPVDYSEYYEWCCAWHQWHTQNNLHASNPYYRTPYNYLYPNQEHSYYGDYWNHSKSKSETNASQIAEAQRQYIRKMSKY